MHRGTQELLRRSFAMPDRRCHPCPRRSPLSRANSRLEKALCRGGRWSMPWSAITHRWTSNSSGTRTARALEPGGRAGMGRGQVGAGPGVSVPVDHARISRRVVRRRAKGMTADAVAAALEDALFDTRTGLPPGAPRRRRTRPGRSSTSGSASANRHLAIDAPTRRRHRARRPTRTGGRTAVSRRGAKALVQLRKSLCRRLA